MNAGGLGGSLPPMATGTRAEQFPDANDPVLYPRLSEKKLRKLAGSGQRRSFRRRVRRLSERVAASASR